MRRREPNRRPWAAHRISRISRDNCLLLWAWMAPDTGPCCSRWTHYCPHSCRSPGLEVATGSPCCFALLPLRSKARAGAPDSWCMAYSHTCASAAGRLGKPHVSRHHSDGSKIQCPVETHKMENHQTTGV